MADSEDKKAAQTAVRIPALVVAALLVMLLIGILIYKVA
jgi:F0F1-type ATP synthase assembly protein I